MLKSLFRGWVVATAIFSFNSTAFAEEWFPLEVDIWQPPFNADRSRVDAVYHPLEKASKEWRICVSIPHLKDAYWITVNYALVDEAKRLGVRLRLDEAGGYNKLDVQRAQVNGCMSKGADALIVSSISADGLNDLVDNIIDEGKPVVDLINSISAKRITARAAVDFWDNGYQAGEYLLELVKGQFGRVLWFPGPKGPVWSASGDQGFRDALADSTIEIVSTEWGDTGRSVQAELIEKTLDRYDDIDFIVGTTVSAEAAVDILRERGLSDKIRVLSYYYGPGVHNLIRRGLIAGAPTDKQGLQARMALDIAIRALEGETFVRHVGPKVEVITRQSLRDFDVTTSIPPKGFRPVFSFNDWVD